MGIGRMTAALLCLEGQRRSFGGAVLEIGRQAICLDHDDLARVAGKTGFSPRPVARSPLIPYQFNPAKPVMSDQAFFAALGFDTVESLDGSDFEGATHVFDLNSPATPPDLAERYDVIIDTGTMEHVFHIPNLLANLHRMTKPGGRILSVTPASNMVNHGFYSFSPCFFIDYFAANGYELSSLLLLKFDGASADPTGWMLRLVPDQDDALLDSLARIGGLDGHTYMLASVATRLPRSRCDAVPIQGCYRSLWASRPAAAGPRRVFPYVDGKWVLPWEEVPC